MTCALVSVTISTHNEHGLHAPVEVPGLHPLGPCIYTPEWATKRPGRACPATLDFTHLHLLSQKQVDHYNQYSAVTATATRLPRLVDTVALRQHASTCPWARKRHPGKTLGGLSGIRVQPVALFLSSPSASESRFSESPRSRMRACVRLRF